MSSKRIISGLTALAAVVAVGSIAAPAANAATIATIRNGDLNTSATKPAGHVEFLADGLHVWTDDASGDAKAAGYFALTGGLPTSASLKWFGTTPQPGQQLVFDVDGTTGNGNDWNVLVGEPVYGGNWWLTGSSSQIAKDADPSGANDGGNGSAYFGTLAEWAANLPDGARITAGGFSLGSGVKGDGVIDSITYGDTTYRFTSNAAAPATTVRDVHGKSAITVRAHSVRVDLWSEAQPANTVIGKRLTWRVTVDGRTVLRTSQAFGDHDVVRQPFADGSGRHVIKVFKNGVQVRSVVARY